MMGRLIALVACLAVSGASAQTVLWNSDPSQVNVTSNGEPMDGEFRFELGVFTGSFVPNNGNMTQWAAHWRAAQRVIYDADIKRFAGSFTATNNDPPFIADAPAYVWGFRGDGVAGEWILFRAAAWTWPDAGGYPPAFDEWFAKDAAAIMGTIHSSGSPFLMKSVAVAGVLPPSTSWAQWREVELAGGGADGPADDPDHDGVSNLLEFVFGLSPKHAGPPPVTTLGLMDVGGEKHGVISIPRRADHSATLVVQVSDDLVTWNEGPAFTEVIADGPAAWIVRDRTFSDTRFMRLKAMLPAP